MKKIVLGAALAALSVGLPGAALAQRTPAAVVVLVDTDRISAECTACRAASTQLQSMITSYQQRSAALAQPIQTEMQSINQAAQTASNQPAGAARTASENTLRQRATALEARQAAAQQELARTEQNIQSSRANVARQIQERLNPIINRVMTAHGANLAMDFSATLAHGQALDVTTEVLTALNAALPSVSVTPLPQQSAAPTAPQPTGR
ncbi:MAG TPA: OmpH family outer membrane protein [Allosphingosinicella sp.]|jgi:Skp family chaperone for outer membrane proteins